MDVKFSDFKIIPLLDTIKRCDMDDDTYFSPKYRDYISNSRLKYINPVEGGGPDQYKDPPHLSTQSLSVGSAVHECLLQPESFVLAPKMGKPSAKLGQVADYVYSHKRDDVPIETTIIEASRNIGYYVNQINSKIPSIIEKCTPYWNKLDEPRDKKEGITEIILSDSEYDTVSFCLESCNDNKDFINKLHPTNVWGDSIESYNEIAFFIDFLVMYKGTEKAAILKFKMKADNYTVNKTDNIITLNDLKTTSKPVNWFMNEEYGSLVHYHYYRQLALYLWVLQLYCLQHYGASKEAGWKFDANFLVVQTSFAYDSKCYNLNKYWLNKGFIEGQELLKRIAAYKMFGWNSEINFE